MENEKIGEKIEEELEKEEIEMKAKPDFRVVQPDRDREGKIIYRRVGGMWRNISKSGNEFYTLRIGELRLLVFPNK